MINIKRIHAFSYWRLSRICQISYTTLYIIINWSCSGQERRISSQPFYRDDRQSRVDHVRNGTGSGHCCAKRAEEWILPRMDFGWDYAVPLSIPFDGRIYRATTILDGLPARNNLQSRKSRNINDANSKVLLISTNRIFILTNNSRYNTVI